MGDIVYIEDEDEANELHGEIVEGLHDAEVSLGVGRGGVNAGGSIPWTWILAGLGGLFVYNKYISK